MENRGGLNMQYDRQIRLTRFKKNTTKTNLVAEPMQWSHFVAQLRYPVETGAHTLPEYLALEKSQQDSLKDRGGYVGGEYVTSTRTSGISFRDFGVLDCDFIPSGGLAEFISKVEALGLAFVLHTTRKHMDSSPKARLCVLFSRPVTKIEYEPIMRKIAEKVGIGVVDPKSFSAVQLMYLPTVCKDAEYLCKNGGEVALDADGVLAEYVDWHNRHEWCRSTRDTERELTLGSDSFMQRDPTEKKGVIGAFCREYDCISFSQEFLPHLYTPSETVPDKFTWVLGTTTSGVQVRDGGKFFISYHESDPTCGIMVNAYDLGRRHMFPDMTEKQGCDKMDAFVLSIPSVKARFDRERLECLAGGSDGEDDKSITAKVIQQLDLGGDPLRVIKSITNVRKILNLDPRLEGIFTYDSFMASKQIIKRPPWMNPGAEFAPYSLEDGDMSCFKEFLEKYTMFPSEKAKDGLDSHFKKCATDVLKDYLNGLDWDRTPRVDKFFIDYMGAEDNHYNRRAARLWLCGAVARGLHPGIQFDLIPIISGKPGDGKTANLISLGKDWILDRVSTLKGDKASEQLAGKWIVHLDELDNFDVASDELIKSFLGARKDFRRVPYEIRPKDFKRRCVFVGTTNKKTYLSDPTGNRRFIPIDADVIPIAKHRSTLTPSVVDQIWAEAVARYDNGRGEKIYLDEDDEDHKLFFDAQESHRDVSIIENDILNFIDSKVPVNWNTVKICDRLTYWENGDEGNPALVDRTKVCAREILIECLKEPISRGDNKRSKEINSQLDTLVGWEKVNTAERFGVHGVMKPWYRRKA
jgi:predicted P-loop ATPase